MASRATIVVAVGAIVAVVIRGNDLRIGHGTYSRGWRSLSKSRCLEMTRGLVDVRTERSGAGVKSGTNGLVANISDAVATVGRKLAAVAVGQSASRNSTHAGVVILQVLLSSLVGSGAHSRAGNRLQGRNVVGRERSLQLGGIGNGGIVVGGGGRVRAALGELLLHRLHFKGVAIVSRTVSSVRSLGGHGRLR